MNATGEYDLAFSLGQACACSMTLRKANMQFASFPFDWLAGATLPSRVDILIHHFDRWMEKEDFVYDGTNPINGLGMFHNRKTGFKHLHDFSDGPIEDSLAQVVAKYARREKRLFDLLGKSMRVLAVYIDSSNKGGRQTPSIDDLVKARADMSAAFPGVSFDFIHFILDRDTPYDRRAVDSPAEGITEIRFNYHDDETDVCFSAVADSLRSLGISVRDYRTKAERKAHNLKMNMKKYKVNTRLGLLVAKAKERLRSMFGIQAARR